MTNERNWGRFLKTPCNFYEFNGVRTIDQLETQKETEFHFCHSGSSMFHFKDKSQNGNGCLLPSSAARLIFTSIFNETWCRMRSSADGRSAVLLAERQRDEAIEFKPVRAVAHSVLMVSESRQRDREKSSHSKYHLFWLQGLAYPHWSLGGIQPPPPKKKALWSAQGALIFCRYLSLPSLPPRCSKRGSIHPSIWPNQVWIELTAVRQSLPALRLQICNLCRRLLRIFSSNINTGIVSYKYIKCHCWLGSRY